MTDTAFARLYKRTGGPNLIRQFGETVTYYDRNGSAGREISAMVERGTLEVISETGDVTSQAIIVRVENDSVRGIASDEIDTGGDELSVPTRIGETSQRRAIVRVLNDNAGLVRFLCQ